MARHSESCGQCKRNITRLLERIYGRVIEQYSLGLFARLEAYKGETCFEALALIYEKLQSHRGHRAFVRRNKLSRVDYFLPVQRVVIEFDESQHFTKPRLISLRHYPPNLRLGYDRQKWMTLATKLDRHDNNPVPYRDEQRAWYDTLKDFSSMILDNAPTVRLYAKDRQWCRLDPERKEDIDLFYNLYLAPTSTCT